MMASALHLERHPLRGTPISPVYIGKLGSGMIRPMLLGTEMGDGVDCAARRVRRDGGSAPRCA